MLRIDKLEKIARFNNREVDGFTLLDQKIVEEYGEFLQALFKYDRDSKSFIEELADVIIVTRQLIETLSEQQKFMLDDSIDYKLDRTIKRLKLDKED